MKHLPKHIVFLFAVYLLGIIFFTAFRVVLLLSEIRQLEPLPDSFGLLTQAFIMGFRFDTVISGYFLIVPLLILSITSSLRWEAKWYYKLIGLYIIVIYSFGFLIYSIDIPFFKYYFSHVTVIIFNWTGDAGFIFKMIYEEIAYFIFLFVFLIAGFVFFIILRKLRIRILEATPLRTETQSTKATIYNIAVSLAAVALMFIGIRGRLNEKSPIRVGTAFFSNYAFPNQLGLNPVFTFIRSALDANRPENKTLHLMNDQTAIENARRYFQIDSISQYSSPVARKVVPLSQSRNANVIVVVMESMSANKMLHFGNKDNLTPFLDSLANSSYCFDNAYTAGIHTFNGEYGTLFAYPALLKQHPMNTAVIGEYTGFPNTLKDHGYQSIYFTTHDDQFDNIGGFLSANNFQFIVSLKDYPSEKVLSTLGVPDDYMFEFSIPKLNDLFKDGKPFFAAYMTASDHGPLIIPEDVPFHPRSNDMQHQIVEYADWSIEKFIKLASLQEWFRNTIFVFVADHGSVTENNIYDMPLSYHHTPLIIYAPYLLTSAEHFSSLGGQIDIFPTVMGLLNIEYINNTMGVDLLREQRPCIYFCADSKIGCLDQEYFYVFRDNGIESLYKYRDSDVANYFDKNKSKADSLKTYAFSMMQTAQWLISNNKTGKQNNHYNIK